METIGWQVVCIGPTYAFVKKLPLAPFFLIKVLRHHQWLSVNQIQLIKQKYWPLIFKQEPLIIEKQKDSFIYFRIEPKNSSPLLPTKTIWLNLSLPEKEVLTRMKAKTRYNLKKAVKNKLNVEIIPGNKIKQAQLKAFYELWSHNKPHNWLFKPHFSELNHLVKSFGKNCFFVFVFYNSQISNHKSILAACSLQLASSNMCFYWHNASTPDGKKLFAPTLCVWEAVKEARRRKLKVFDFEGVWDERFPKLNQGWKGLSRFKEGFTTK